MNVLRALARLASLSIAVAAVGMVWTPGSALAATQSCQPGSGPPCQQAFLQINKTTGVVSAAVALPGGNQEGADYDGVECQLGSSGHCFLAADHSGFLLMSFSSFTCDPHTDTTPVGTSATFTIDAIAFDGHNGTLYAAVGDQLKVVDQSTGAMKDTSSWLGVAQGTDGSEELAHVAAMTFDPATNDLFGVEDRGTRPWLLFRINPDTGAVVHNSFGAGQDYVEIAPDGGRQQAYGIVVAGGTMYVTLSHNDTDPHLAKLDPAAGATTDIGWEGVTQVEGLTTDSTGNLYALAGSGGAVVGTLPCPAPFDPGHPAPAVAPASTPPVSVLGLKETAPTTPQQILPVTGSNTGPAAALAILCYVLGAGALLASRRALAKAGGRHPA